MPTCRRKVFLVGGFGSSALLLNRLRQGLPGVEVISIANPSVAIVRGAVYFAAISCITSRKAKRTYALVTSTPFKPSDPQHKRLAHTKFWSKRKGTNYISVLDVMVTKGSDIPWGHKTQRKTYGPLEDDQNAVTFSFKAMEGQGVIDPAMATLLGQ